MFTHNEVYSVVRLIPEGRVASYGDIAHQLGHPKHSRAVGQVLKLLPNHLANPYLPQPPPPPSKPFQVDAVLPLPTPNDDWVPWHRVISSSGVISPRTSGESAVRMQADYLRAEDVDVKDGRRVSMARYRYDWKTKP